MITAPVPQETAVARVDAEVVEGSAMRDLVDAGSVEVKPEPAQPAPEVAVVIGRIIDSGSRPVVSANLQMWSQDDNDRGVQGVTEADGTFRLEAKTPGACDLIASASSFGFVRREALRVAIGVLDVGDLVLQPKPALIGRLIYPDGQPIVDLGVGVVRTTGSHTRPTVGVFFEDVKTDADGRFKIVNLTEGTYGLNLPYQTLSGEEEPTAQLATGQAEQELTIARHRIRLRGPWGVILDGWGQEQSGEVRAALQTGRGWLALLDRPSVSFSGNSSEFLVTYDSWWRVWTYDEDKWFEELVHAQSIRNETEVHLELLPVETSSTLRLRVRTVDGSLPKSAKLDRIYASALNSPGHFETAGRDGDDFLFRFTPGSYQMRIRFDPVRSALDRFAAVAQEVHFRADEETLLSLEAWTGGRVQVTLHLPDNKNVRRVNGLVVSKLGPFGKPVNLRQYQVTNASGYTRGTPPSETPFVCLRMLRPGRHELTVTAKGYQPQRMTAYIEEGKITPLDVYLVR